MSQSSHTVTVDLSEVYKKLGFDPSISAIGAPFRLIIGEKLQALVTLPLVGECLAEATKHIDRERRKRKTTPKTAAPTTDKPQPTNTTDEKR